MYRKDGILKCCSSSSKQSANVSLEIALLLRDIQTKTHGESSTFMSPVKTALQSFSSQIPLQPALKFVLYLCLNVQSIAFFSCPGKKNISRTDLPPSDNGMNPQSFPVCSAFCLQISLPSVLILSQSSVYWPHFSLVSSFYYCLSLVLQCCGLGGIFVLCFFSTCTFLFSLCCTFSPNSLITCCLISASQYLFSSLTPYLKKRWAFSHFHVSSPTQEPVAHRKIPAFDSMLRVATHTSGTAVSLAGFVGFLLFWFCSIHQQILCSNSLVIDNNQPLAHIS